MRTILQKAKMPSLKSIAGTALLAALLPLSGWAQSEARASDEGSPSRFGISVNGGLTFSFTDVSKSKTAPVVGLGAHYFATKYAHVNIDVQKGSMKGGVPVQDGVNEMGFENSFFYAVLTARLFPVALVRNDNNNKALSLLSCVYGGTGIGILSSSVKSNEINMPDYGSLREYSGTDIVVPVKVGFILPVVSLNNSKKLSINVDYRVNLCLTDKIDGYVPTVSANERNDAYNQLTAGLMLQF